jgi:hypothetical protein
VADAVMRDMLGMVVREAWVAWAGQQPAPKPSWLLPWDQLAESDREVDRLIGEAVRAFTIRYLDASCDRCRERHVREAAVDTTAAALWPAGEMPPERPERAVGVEEGREG